METDTWEPLVELTRNDDPNLYVYIDEFFMQGAAREVVAIKCVEKSKLNRISTENLLTEIELLKTLRHEHIVELKDFQVGLVIDSDVKYFSLRHLCVFAVVRQD